MSAIEFRGRTQGLRAWSRELGIPESTLRTRLRRAGLSVADALSRPVAGPRPLAAGGRSQPVSAWVRELGVPESTLRSRLASLARRGRPAEEAVASPLAPSALPLPAVAPVAPTFTPGDGRTTCRRCGRPKVNRPRGLCWSCYYTPGVRERHPSTSKFGLRGIGHRPPKTVPQPTTARGGTPAKVAVLTGRAERGECLWHPLDA